MKPGLPFALTMIAVVGSGIVLAAFNGHAEQSPGNIPAGSEKHVFSPADRAAFLDARIAAQHGAQTGADQLVVVNQQNPHRAR